MDFSYEDYLAARAEEFEMLYHYWNRWNRMPLDEQGEGEPEAFDLPYDPEADWALPDPDAEAEFYCLSNDDDPFALPEDPEDPFSETRWQEINAPTALPVDGEATPIPDSKAA